MLMIIDILVTETGRFPCAFYSAMKYLIWIWLFQAFALRTARTWLLVQGSRLRREGALILAERAGGRSSKYTVSNEKHPASGAPEAGSAGHASGGDHQFGSKQSNSLASSPNHYVPNVGDASAIQTTTSQATGQGAAAGGTNQPKDETAVDKDKQRIRQEEEDLLHRLIKYDYWSDEWRMIKIVFLSGIIGLILNMFISIPFGWYSDMYAGTCVGLDQSLYLIFAFVGIYECVLLPIAIREIRKCSDAFHLTATLKMMLMVCPSVFVVYGAVVFFVPADAIIFKYMSTNDIGVVMLAAAQFWTITVPMWKDYLMINRAANGKSETSRVMFTEALCDEIQYEDLRKLAVEEFSIENMLFWEAYQGMMRKLLHVLIQQPQAKNTDVIHRITNGVFKNHSDLKSELAIPVSKRLTTWLATSVPETVPDMTPVSVPMPTHIATIISKAYKLFIARGTMFEVNIPDVDRDEVLVVMAKIDGMISHGDSIPQQALSQLESPPGSAPSSPTPLRATPQLDYFPTSTAHPKVQPGDKHLTNVLLQFTNLDPASMPKNTGDKLIVPITLLDKIKNHVLSIIYFNTYSRHMKNRAALGLKRSSMVKSATVSHHQSGANSPSPRRISHV